MLRVILVALPICLSHQGKKEESFVGATLVVAPTGFKRKNASFDVFLFYPLQIVAVPFYATALLENVTFTPFAGCRIPLNFDGNV